MLRILCTSVAAVAALAMSSFAQSSRYTEFELGAKTSLLSTNSALLASHRTVAAVNGTFTWNFHSNFALDSEVGFYPQRGGVTAQTGGRAFGLQVGVIGGVRRRHFALFAKS